MRKKKIKNDDTNSGNTLEQVLPEPVIEQVSVIAKQENDNDVTLTVSKESYTYLHSLVLADKLNKLQKRFENGVKVIDKIKCFICLYKT